jgi:WS/DGAT/MGAT family acyltransferase
MPVLLEPVAGADAVWLQDSPTNLMVINAVFVTDRMDLATFRRTFCERVLEVEAGRRYPRFRRRVAWIRGRPWWEEDPGFDVAHHIVAAGEPVHSTAQLQDYVGREASRPLPPDRSPWQIQVMEEFEDEGTAFLVRIHHCMGDGISLVPIIFELMDPAEPGSAGHLRPAAGAPQARSPLQALGLALRVPLAAPGILLQRMLWPRDRHALHGPPVSGSKRVGWTRPFDLQVVKEAKNRLGATVNDVLMAVVSGAFSRYLQAKAGTTVATIRISMPVNVRPPNEPLRMGNRFAAVPLELPAGIHELRRRVLAVKRRLDALKQSVEPIVVYHIVNVLLQTLPQGASRSLIDFLANKCTAVVTNVPGPQRPLLLAGRRVRSLIFWVPQRADIGLGISMMSFSGKVQIGVLADARLVPEPGDMVQAFEAEFEELRSV